MSLNLTPDPSGLQFKPSTPYGTIPDGSGLKLGAWSLQPGARKVAPSARLWCFGLSNRSYKGVNDKPFLV